LGKDPEGCAQQVQHPPTTGIIATTAIIAATGIIATTAIIA
jgi:hypothetical protein